MTATLDETERPLDANAAVVAGQPVGECADHLVLTAGVVA